MRTDAEIEAAAKAWCISCGVNPNTRYEDTNPPEFPEDEFEFLTMIDGSKRRVRMFYAWRKQDIHMRAAIAAADAAAPRSARTETELEWVGSIETEFGEYPYSRRHSLRVLLGRAIAVIAPSLAQGQCMEEADRMLSAAIDAAASIAPRPADETNAAVNAERNRCAAIVEAARFDEIDRDWRSIIARIESGEAFPEPAAFRAAGG